MVNRITLLWRKPYLGFFAAVLVVALLVLVTSRDGVITVGNR